MVDENGGLTPVQAQIADFLIKGPKRRVIESFSVDAARAR